MLYSKYCISGVMPDVPNVPVLPDNPNDNIGDGTNIPSQFKEKTLMCTYNINTTGDTILYKYFPEKETYIEKIIYNGEEITPHSAYTSTNMWTNNRYCLYNFNKMGDIKIEYVLKENTTSMNYVYFGDTKITEITIPSCITTIQDDFYGGKIFDYYKGNAVYLTKIISLNKIAPSLEGSILSIGSFGDSMDVYQRGTLYVPKDCAINYASWMGSEISSGLSRLGWLIKELDY